MSRYLERAGNTARLVEINLLHLLEAEDALPEAAQWRPLLASAAARRPYAERYDGAEVTAGARHPVHDPRSAPNPNAIRTSLRLARENARVVRDRISKEMWEAINELWLRTVDRQRRALAARARRRLYAEVRNGVARFHGLTVSTMMRGEAFGFYLLGTCLERADMTARILDVKYHLLLPDVSMVGSPLDYYQWAALLKSLSGFEAYPAPLPRRPAPGRRRRVRDLRARLPALAALRGRPHGARAAARSAAAAPTRPPPRPSARSTRPAREIERRERSSSRACTSTSEASSTRSAPATPPLAREYFEHYLGDARVRYLIEHETRARASRAGAGAPLRAAPRPAATRTSVALARLRDRGRAARAAARAPRLLRQPRAPLRASWRRTTELTVRLRAEVETLLENPFDYAAARAGRASAHWSSDSLRAEPRAARLPPPPQPGGARSPTRSPDLDAAAARRVGRRCFEPCRG